MWIYCFVWLNIMNACVSRYAFEPDIGVAVALEGPHHSSRLKAGVPAVRSMLQGRAHLRNAVTTLLEFVAVCVVVVYQCMSSPMRSLCLYVCACVSASVCV
jgi:hypothetical protein